MPCTRYVYTHVPLHCTAYCGVRLCMLVPSTDEPCIHDLVDPPSTTSRVMTHGWSPDEDPGSCGCLCSPLHPTEMYYVQWSPLVPLCIPMHEPMHGIAGIR